MINQFVIVRKWNTDKKCSETVPCWVPVLVPIIHPADVYKKFQAEYANFVKSHTGDEENVMKEYELLLDDWRENDKDLFSANEILAFARELESDSLVISPTYFNCSTEHLVTGYQGLVNVTLNKKVGVEGA